MIASQIKNLLTEELLSIRHFSHSLFSFLHRIYQSPLARRLDSLCPHTIYVGICLFSMRLSPQAQTRHYLQSIPTHAENDEERKAEKPNGNNLVPKGTLSQYVR